MLKPLDVELEILGAGEQQAILLWEQLGADILVLDDREAREIARQRGVAITGLLGLLDRAAELELIDFAEAIARLRLTTFRASSRLIEGLLAQHRDR